MANSLQDQLMKAGLVDAKQVKGFNKEKKKQERQQRKHRIETVDETKESVRQAQLEKAERDRELNAKRNEEARNRAIVAQIKQLIDTSRIARDGGDIAYNFTDGTKIKKLYVTRDLQDRLGSGQLAIVKFDEKFEIVPQKVADKIRERDASYVVSQQTRSSEVDEDDPYAAYQVPDDLMW